MYQVLQILPPEVLAAYNRTPCPFNWIIVLITNKLQSLNTEIPWIVRILGDTTLRTIQNQHYSRLLLSSDRDPPLFKEPFLVHEIKSTSVLISESKENSNGSSYSIGSWNKNALSVLVLWFKIQCKIQLTIRFQKVLGEKICLISVCFVIENLEEK